VQGEDAGREVARAIRQVSRHPGVDVVIVARGGGSLEDLWAFNEEIVARAIADSPVPVVSGVGHEIDFTIADFAADLRAPTPSQAAELAVPDQSEWIMRFARLEQRVAHCARLRIAAERRHFGVLEHRLSRCHPAVAMRELGQRLDELEARAHRAVERLIGKRRMRLARLTTAVAHANPAQRLTQIRARWRHAAGDLRRALLRRVEHTKQRVTLAERALASLSPLATLQRGYAIVARRAGGALVTDAAKVETGTALDVRLASGRLLATVDEALPADDG
jgi:exodeoxyribonuclease VII large subunit